VRTRNKLFEGLPLVIIWNKFANSYFILQIVFRLPLGGLKQLKITMRSVRSSPENNRVTFLWRKLGDLISRFCKCRLICHL